MFKKLCNRIYILFIYIYIYIYILIIIHILNKIATLLFFSASLQSHCVIYSSIKHPFLLV